MTEYADRLGEAKDQAARITQRLDYVADNEDIPLAMRLDALRDAREAASRASLKITEAIMELAR